MKKIVYETLIKISKDEIARYTILSLFSIFGLLGFYSVFLSIALFLIFVLGFTTGLLFLKHKNNVGTYFQKCKETLGYKEYVSDVSTDCDVCGSRKCERNGSAHKLSPVREPWKGIFVDVSLDSALDNFYSKIINVFVSSWFAPLSNDEEFLYFLRQNLREATCRLILKLKTLDIPVLITNSLLPMFFSHYEKINQMLVKDKVPMDKLVIQFLRNDYPIHPAVINRNAEIEYIKKIVKCLIPRLFTNENFKSKIFFELIVEIFTFWTMLPLMDVISDPNLLNLLVVYATDKTQKRQKYAEKEQVVFLERFLKRTIVELNDKSIEKHQDLLTDQIKLYSFMQFLKKEGAVDILRFYLDVDNLNNELLDPKITTDPSKLSSLHQQSEKLLSLFNQSLHDEKGATIESLSDALENVKSHLQGKWKTAFYRTSNYFELNYGSRDIQDVTVLKPIDLTIGPVTKIGNRLKGALKTPGTLDGEPISIEAIEIPTVWECLIDNQLQAGNTIYNSVTSKLRREKGQSLDAFMTSFMHSIEQCPEIGEDVMDMKIDKIKHHYNVPGNNTVFGNLFDIKRDSKYYSSNLGSTSETYIRMAPSQCLVYILVNILNAPRIITRLALAFCSISQKTIDSLLNNLLYKLLMAGLYQPRIAKLIALLESHLFDKKQPAPTAQELFTRQQTARSRLKEIHKQLDTVIDVLQYPALNKHLMYSLLDKVLSEMYPEFEY